MLVLTRKLQEQIRIGDDIVITVLQFRGNSIRIGIEAPANVRVLRNELPQKNAGRTTQEIEIPLAALNQLMNNRIDETKVQVVRTERNTPPSVNVERHPVARPLPIGSRHPNGGGRGPLAGKLQARRANGDVVASNAAGQQDDVVDADPCPEFDMLGENHLSACREENAALMAAV
ncbi:MAG: carbon storage regulator [Pirellulales bacterium]